MKMIIKTKSNRLYVIDDVKKYILTKSMFLYTTSTGKYSLDISDEITEMRIEKEFNNGR